MAGNFAPGKGSRQLVLIDGGRGQHPSTIPPWNTVAPGMDGFARFMEGVLREPGGKSPTVTIIDEDAGVILVTGSRLKKTS